MNNDCVNDNVNNINHEDIDKGINNYVNDNVNNRINNGDDVNKGMNNDCVNDNGNSFKNGNDVNKGMNNNYVNDIDSCIPSIPSIDCDDSVAYSLLSDYDKGNNGISFNKDDTNFIDMTKLIITYS